MRLAESPGGFTEFGGTACGSEFDTAHQFGTTSRSPYPEWLVVQIDLTPRGLGVLAWSAEAERWIGAYPLRTDRSIPLELVPVDSSVPEDEALFEVAAARATWFRSVRHRLLFDLARQLVPNYNAQYPGDRPVRAEEFSDWLHVTRLRIGGHGWLDMFFAGIDGNLFPDVDPIATYDPEGACVSIHFAARE